MRHLTTQRQAKLMKEACSMEWDSGRDVANTCQRCQHKMQTIAELLLLSYYARPIRYLNKSLGYNIEKINSTMRIISSLVEDVLLSIHGLSNKSEVVCEKLEEILENVILLSEYCSQVAYMLTTKYPGATPAVLGIIDKYEVSRAGLEVDISCSRLKQSKQEELALSSQLVIDLCSNISKYISILTDICRVPAEELENESLKDQFKLCVKSVTCAVGCLIASVKTFKSEPTWNHHSRLIVFAEPVIASVSALVSLATEDEFIGTEAALTREAKDVQREILSVCMSVVSACIQLCRIVREVAFSTFTSHYRDKAQMCLETVERASKQLTDSLQQHRDQDESSPPSSEDDSPLSNFQV
ncbi:hypothetical protein ScPMuIL_002711 [Solemya velum]